MSNHVSYGGKHCLIFFILIVFILGIQTRHSRSSIRSHFNYNVTRIDGADSTDQYLIIRGLMVKTISW